MPRHLAVGVNAIRGRVSLNNSKYAYIYFIDEETGQQVYFTKRPVVSLTITAETTNPVARISWIKQGNLYIGCKIAFTQNVTLEVEWAVFE